MLTYNSRNPSRYHRPSLRSDIPSRIPISCAGHPRAAVFGSCVPRCGHPSTTSPPAQVLGTRKSGRHPDLDEKDMRFTSEILDNAKSKLHLDATGCASHWITDLNSEKVKLTKSRHGGSFRNSQPDWINYRIRVPHVRGKMSGLGMSSCSATSSGAGGIRSLD